MSREYHYVMTVDREPGLRTHSGTMSIPEGATRSDAYAWAYEQILKATPGTGSPAVVFFSLEPNSL
jgi:hypothetical protein